MQSRLQTFLFSMVLFSGRKASSFSMMSSNTNKKIFGIPQSGWQSPQWNWGSAVGTGHDCARICRGRLSTVVARQDYVNKLLDGDEGLTDTEEIKLTLALTWQRGRWDGSDGGPEGYGQVLSFMAQAKRYESTDGISRLVEDMQQRFQLLNPSTEDQDVMMSLIDIHSTGTAFRKCSGLVLKHVGFIENGC